MARDSHGTEYFAGRLVERLGNPEPFRLDPAEASKDRFGITVVFRDTVDTDCDIDGSYDHELKLIKVAAAASAGRRKFTTLHELGHALGRTDNELQDWLFTQKTFGRLDEERVVNAFAGSVLLPDHLVNEHIPDVGPTAWDVAQLATAATASREAVCVRASMRLRGPGLVALARGSVVQFASTRGLAFGIGRGSDQGADSFFARAAGRDTHREDGVRITFPSGVRSTQLIGDAAPDGDGHTFVVLMEHSAPWRALTPVTDGPEGFEIDCELCDRSRITFARECVRCGDRPCPDHGCACGQGTFRPPGRKCTSCNAGLPLAARPEVELCDNCGG